MATKNKTVESSDKAEKKRFWNNDMEAIIGIMVVLLILGTINVFSSSFILAEAEFDNPYHFLQRHLINIAVGLVAFGICFKYDYHTWRRFMPYILGFSLFALIFVLWKGRLVNGARRWIDLGFTFQPAEFCKLVSIMITAAYLSLQVRKERAIEIFTPQLGIVGAMAILTELEPDMGTASIIAGIPIIMLIVAGLEKKKVMYMLAGVLVLAAGLIWYQPYRLERLKVVFDPWSDAQNVGYQTVQSLSAIGSGELTGMGLGVGVSKYDYLPEAHTGFCICDFLSGKWIFGRNFCIYVICGVCSVRGKNRRICAG